MNHRSRVIALSLAALAVASHGAFAADPGEKAQAVIDKGLAYLKSQQQPDGGWQRSNREPPAITAIALRPFVQEPAYNSKTDFVAKGFEKLLAYQNEDGGIYKDLLASYNTAIAVSTLVKANDPAFKPQIDKAVEYLKRLQWTQDTKPDFADAKEENTGRQVVRGADDPFYGGWGYGGR
ncbi:MAG TPA: prenyltransferase/squalene oxidase repeat-containing protein, partial [Tepidisphaeraceae bacterium]